MTGIRAKAEADLRTAEARYEAAHSRAVAAQADEAAEQEHLNRMRTVWEWVQQQGDSAEPSAPDEQSEDLQARRRIVFGKPVPEVTLTDLCFETLVTFGRAGSSTKQIRDHLTTEGHLTADGREFSLDQVRATLRYLAHKKPPQVETSRGSGIWRLSKAAKAATTSFTPAGNTVGVSTAGANGSSFRGAAVPPEQG